MTNFSKNISQNLKSFSKKTHLAVGTRRAAYREDKRVIRIKPSDTRHAASLQVNPTSTRPQRAPEARGGSSTLPSGAAAMAVCIPADNDTGLGEVRQ